MHDCIIDVVLLRSRGTISQTSRPFKCRERARDVLTVDCSETLLGQNVSKSLNEYQKVYQPAEQSKNGYLTENSLLNFHASRLSSP